MHVPPAEDAADAPARAPLPGTVVDTSSIAQQLAALRLEIKAAAARLAPQGSPLADGSTRQTDWGAIEAFRSMHTQDEEAARQQLLFASLAQIVTRFGKPTKVELGGTTRTYFIYSREERPVLRVDFRDEVVCGHAVF